MRWAHALVYGRNKVQYKLQTKQPETLNGLLLHLLYTVFPVSLSLTVYFSLSRFLCSLTSSLSLSLSSFFKQEAGPLRSFAIFCWSLDNLTANYRSIFCRRVKCLSVVISLKFFLYCKQSPPVFVCMSVCAGILSYLEPHLDLIVPDS